MALSKNIIALGLCNPQVRARVAVASEPLIDSSSADHDEQCARFKKLKMAPLTWPGERERESRLSLAYLAR